MPYRRYPLHRSIKWLDHQSSPQCQLKALLQLRDDIGSVLSRKAGQLQTQLAALGDGGWITSTKKAVGRPRGSKIKGCKVAPKYSNPKNRSETWAGRGAMPRWMAAEIKKGPRGTKKGTGFN